MNDLFAQLIASSPIAAAGVAAAYMLWHRVDKTMTLYETWISTYFSRIATALDRIDQRTNQNDKE